MGSRVAARHPNDPGVAYSWIQVERHDAPVSRWCPSGVVSFFGWVPPYVTWNGSQGEFERCNPCLRAAPKYCDTDR